MEAYTLILQDEHLELVLQNQRILTFLRLLTYKFLSYQISFQKAASSFFFFFFASSLYPRQKCETNLPPLSNIDYHIFLNFTNLELKSVIALACNLHSLGQILFFLFMGHLYCLFCELSVHVLCIYY